MPKHQKDPVIYYRPSEKEEEPSPVLLAVMKAFGKFNQTTIVTVYNTHYYNREMTEWTALATAQTGDGISYYELYHDGEQTRFIGKHPNTQIERGTS